MLCEEVLGIIVAEETGSSVASPSLEASPSASRVTSEASSLTPGVAFISSCERFFVGDGIVPLVSSIATGGELGGDEVDSLFGLCEIMCA